MMFTNTIRRRIEFIIRFIGRWTVFAKRQFIFTVDTDGLQRPGKCSQNFVVLFTFHSLSTDEKLNKTWSQDDPVLSNGLSLVLDRRSLFSVGTCPFSRSIHVPTRAWLTRPTATHLRFSSLRYTHMHNYQCVSEWCNQLFDQRERER